MPLGHTVLGAKRNWDTSLRVLEKVLDIGRVGRLGQHLEGSLISRQIGPSPPKPVPVQK